MKSAIERKAHEEEARQQKDEGHEQGDDPPKSLHFNMLNGRGLSYSIKKQKHQRKVNQKQNQAISLHGVRIILSMTLVKWQIHDVIPNRSILLELCSICGEKRGGYVEWKQKCTKDVKREGNPVETMIQILSSNTFRWMSIALRLTRTFVGFCLCAN